MELRAFDNLSGTVTRFTLALNDPSRGYLVDAGLKNHSLILQPNDGNFDLPSFLANNGLSSSDASDATVLTSDKPIMVLKTGDERSVLANANRIVLGFEEISISERNEVIALNGLTEDWFDEIGSFGVFIVDGSTLSDVFDQLSNDERISFAEPDFIDGDDEYTSQSDGESSLPVVPFPTSLWNHEALGVNHELDFDGTGVVVAVVDGRAELTHPAIANALLDPNSEFNFEDNLRVVDHGTGIMSVIAGQITLEDGKKMGIAPNAKLLPLGIDTYRFASYAQRSRAINFAAQIAETGKLNTSNGEVSVPRLIVNCSWKLREAVDTSSMRISFARLVQSGAICVCSAGNENTNQPHFPSMYPGILRVAGVTKDFRKNDRSNYGETVAFSAPGGSDWPYDFNDIFSATVDGRYTYAYGTSFAAPHVAGVLAALWSANPDLSSEDLIALACNEHTKPLDQINPGFESQLGQGLLVLSGDHLGW